MMYVGERLALERKRKGLTIEEVAKATKIQGKFIRALEEGNYKVLPSSAYIQGFIRNYASFLGLPVKEMLAVFRREFDEREYLGVLPESFTKSQQPLQGFRLGTLGLSLILGIFLIVLYVFFQYRAAFFNPALSIVSPKENSIVTDQSITVIGKADANATVTVNDTAVYLDKDGVFKKDISVFNGPEIITVKAVNNFGKISTVTRHITVSLKAQ